MNVVGKRKIRHIREVAGDDHFRRYGPEDRGDANAKARLRVMRIDQECEKRNAHRNEEPEECLEIVGCVGVRNVKKHVKAGVDRRL